MAALAPTVKLNNGYEMPLVGLGTYLSKEGDGLQAIKDAIDAGYRHIDTAHFYQNEKEVGQAIREKIAEGVIKREDMFIVTKLWNPFHHPDNVEKAFEISLSNLGLEYIDLYLMHTPMAYKFTGTFEESGFLPKNADGKLIYGDEDFVDTYKAMEKIQKTGKIRSLGVSNFNSEQIMRILKECEIKPVTNQVECNPTLNQKKLIEFCKKHEITLTAYSPLGRPHYYKEDPTKIPKPALEDPRVIEIGAKYGKSSGQIVLRYLVDIGAIPIPKSSNKERIKQNISIFDFKLNDEELKIMDSFNLNVRTVPFSLCTEHKYFPFNIEF